MSGSRLLVMLCLAALCTACDTMSNVANDALSLVGLGDSTKADPSKSKKPPPPKEDGSGAKDPPPGETKDSGSGEIKDDGSESKGDPTTPTKPEIVRNTQTLTPKAQKRDLKRSAVAPEFKENAPVHILRRIGGAARFMTADDKYVYLDFPQYFSVYDAELNPIAKLPVTFPVLNVRRETLAERTLLYLKEENNALEILELVRGDGNSPAKLVKLDAYDMGGVFTILDAKHVVNFDKDKIEIWDFSDVQKAKIDREMPVGEGDDISVLGPSLYLSRHGFLDVMKADDYTLKSTLRIGRRFGFIGVLPQAGKQVLVLSLLSADGALQGVQTLRLVEDLSGVQDFDRAIIFDQPLTSYSVDLAKGLVLGLETPIDKKERGAVQIYSLTEGRALRGKLAEIEDLQAWALAQGRLYLATGTQISINEINLDQGVIGKAELVKALSGKKTANPPLAQIGADATLQSEYLVKQLKSLLFMSDSRRVALWDRNHLAIMEMSSDRKSHRIYASDNLSSEDFSIQSVPSIESLYFDKALWSDIGWLLYARDKAALYLLDLNFASIFKLPISGLQKFVSWQWFSPDGAEEYILVAVEKPQGPAGKSLPKQGAGKNSAKKSSLKDEKTASAPDVPKPYLLNLYHLVSPEKVELIAGLSFAERPFALVNSEGVLVVVTGSGLVRYDISEPKTPRLIEDVDSSLNFGQVYDIVDARITPKNVDNPLGDRVFLLVRDGELLKIVAFALVHADQRVVMDDFLIEPVHFEGMVLADEGKLMILPTPDGTIFYDITDLNERLEKSFWPLASESVSITDDGTFLCSALGGKGVYCGNLLF